MFYWGTQKTSRPTNFAPTHTQTSEEKAKTSKIHIDIKANHFKIALSSGNSSVARATALKTSKGPFWGVCREKKERKNKNNTKKLKQKTLRQLVKFKTTAGSRPGKLDRADSVSAKFIQLAPLSWAQKPLQQHGAAERSRPQYYALWSLGNLVHRRWCRICRHVTLHSQWKDTFYIFFGQAAPLKIPTKVNFIVESG